MTRAPVNPTLITWARERAGLDLATLANRFPKLGEWENGRLRPTFKQLDAFVLKVHVPVGYLFLSEPRIESVPIADFRTIAGTPRAKPSPDLLDVIYACQARQTWYRSYSLTEKLDGLPFISSASRNHSTIDFAAQIAATLGFTVEIRCECSSWEDAMDRFVAATDDAGILVMESGIVGSNASRALDHEEFRGFALSDSRAPLVFVNSADTKAGQMFTLANALAHLWLGSSGLFDTQGELVVDSRSIEAHYNAVAAELLVPLEALKREISDAESLSNATKRLSRIFKVSSLLILRRLFDAEWLGRGRFDEGWRDENKRLTSLARQRQGVGGGRYRTTDSRVSKRFTKALITSTLEGQTLFRDAYRMLDVRRTSSFERLARQVGVLS